ncbi:MAG: hypothetical protein APR55_04745 [Methanolinea sp. SDB]|nr:MAG: hypothetical protein APR55_04745 [Methanolinea sp. SDB]
MKCGDTEQGDCELSVLFTKKGVSLSKMSCVTLDGIRLFFLDDEEWTATFALVEECKRLIGSQRTPDGYRRNVGIPAGQWRRTW